MFNDWFKSSSCDANGSCAEVRGHAGGVQLRDSKDPAGPVLTFTAAEWAAFLDGARAGEFDHIGHG